MDPRGCIEITSGGAADVFEIDGASNNSVDQVRELRQNLRYMPARSRYKIYIIDEVHMLSIAAFNALLKTLEEPPEHVLFIFATTEPQKIPVTILSRCQRHDFRRIEIESITEHMQMVCNREGYAISSESLWLIAREAGGCMRDALSLLDQILSCTDGQVGPEQILGLLGIIDRKIIFDLSQAILDERIALILDHVHEAFRRGQDLRKLYGEIIEHFRNLMVVKSIPDARKLVDLPLHEIDQMKQQVASVPESLIWQILEMLLKEETAIRFSSQPKLCMEMAFIRIIQTKPVLPIGTLIEKLDDLRKKTIRCSAEVDPDVSGKAQGSAATPSASPLKRGLTSPHGSPPDRSTLALSEQNSKMHHAPSKNVADCWADCLRHLAELKPVLGGALEKSRLEELSHGVFELKVSGNGFAMNVASKNLPLIIKQWAQHTGQMVQINLSADMEAVKAGRKKKQQVQELKAEALKHPLVTEAIEIFNGEVIDIKLNTEE